MISKFAPILILVLAILPLNAEIIKYSGINVLQGNINGNSVAIL